MGTQEITAARYYQGVSNDAQRRPHAVHRLRHDLVGEAGRGAALPARLRPRLGLDRHDVGDRAEDDRRAHLAGPEQRRQRARREPQDGARDRPESRARRSATSRPRRSPTRRRPCSPRTSRCAAARARRTWPPARPRRRPPAASARSPSRRSTTRSTCCSAAAAAASTQTIAGGPDAGKTVVQSAQGKGYQYVTDADRPQRGARARSKPVLGLFNNGNMSLEWTGPAAALGKGNAPAPARRASARRTSRALPT